MHPAVYSRLAHDGADYGALGVVPVPARVRQGVYQPGQVDDPGRGALGQEGDRQVSLDSDHQARLHVSATESPAGWTLITWTAPDVLRALRGVLTAALRCRA